MTHDEHDPADVDDKPDTTSRRRALKIGVGAGIGLAAWSGGSITSLGGTPAYAAGCTFAIQIEMSNGCQPVDRFVLIGFTIGVSYQNSFSGSFPAGYSVTPGGSATAGLIFVPTPTYTLTIGDPGVSCVVRLERGFGCGPGPNLIDDFGPSSGTVSWQFPFYFAGANDRYRLRAICTATGNPLDCLS